MEQPVNLNLPQRINGLGELAGNLWWSWHPETRGLFKRLDRALWKSTGHNPIKLLKEIDGARLVDCSQDINYLASYDAAIENYRASLSTNDTWFARSHPECKDDLVAYFSLEFAVHNSLPLYAGGLGVLAGDYCKEASDLGLPMVGVGFMYPQGYFHQYISQDGWQSEVYDQLNFSDVAISRVFTDDKKLLMVKVPLDNVSVYVAAWLLNLGRVKLYLLDTNLDENAPAYRGLTARLYGGDREMRLLQELIIGLGGVRILRALKLNPTIWHANEGHTSFMMVERVRELIQKGIDFEKALETIRSTTVFTTHTPVPAGNDTFSRDLIEKYFHNYWGQLGVDHDGFMKLGTYADDRSLFNMTVLGLQFSQFRNAVSKLHGDVCKKMWHGIWPEREEKDVPIEYVTNGVHLPTWIAPQIFLLYSTHLGENWIERLDDRTIWESVLSIQDQTLWAMHRWLKLKLINSILDQARYRWAVDRVAPVQPLAMGALLDTEALTIGFCRRFTAYKRASLIFSDINRLKSILNRPLQPVQMIFAGKAHPGDEEGKRFIQQIYNMAKDPEFGGRIAFVEDYDMHIARDLVSGVDVWMNNPRVLMEASGTSGQKASLNGVINLSVLDGWWSEAYNGKNGWAIKEDASQGSNWERDIQTSTRIYDLLENLVIPLFYDRDIDGIPHGWIQMMKETIRSNTPFFNTQRMMKEYTERFYIKAAENFRASV